MTLEKNIREKLLEGILRIDETSDKFYVEVVAKILYYFCLIGLTFCISSKLGYPIPTEIYSEKVFTKLLNEYYLILIAWMFLLVYYGHIVVSIILSNFLLITVTVKLMYSEYKLIKVIDRRSQQEKIDVLTERLAKLNNRLTDKSYLELSSIQKTTFPYIKFISKFSVILVFVYYLILKISFPNAILNELATPLIIATLFAHFGNSIRIYELQKEAF
jgi:hypothetical protein